MVIESRPWRLNGGVLFIDRWPNSGDWKDANLSSFSCWVKAFGIPLHLLTEKNINKIARHAGEVEEIQFDNAQNAHWRNFIRFKATIQSDSSISPGRFVSGNGGPVWVQFKYERLPILCYKCGLIGHEKSLCTASQEVVKDSDGKSIPLFGPWIQSESNISDCFEGAKVGAGKPSRSNGVFEKYKARKMKERVEATEMLLPDIPSGHPASGQDLESDSRWCLASPRKVSITANFTLDIPRISNLVGTDLMDNTGTPAFSNIVGDNPAGHLRNDICAVMNEIKVKAVMEDNYRDTTTPTPAHAHVPLHTHVKSLASPPPRDKHHLLSKDHVVVKINSAARFYIDAIISSSDIIPWRFSGIYGDPNPNQRKNTWELIQRLCLVDHGPWICCGDFNEILDVSEKLGGREKPQCGIDNFRRSIDLCHLIDLGFEVRRGSRFHFEHAWCEDPGCGDIINSSWLGSSGDLGISGLLDRIALCGKNLEVWGKDKFRHLTKEKKTLQEKISCLSSLHDSGSWKTLKECEKNLNSLLDTEERYWRQRSRVSWLKNGDRNTKFFHKKAIARRKKNEILGLCDSNGCWQDDIGVVSEIIQSYFSNIFRSNCPTVDQINLITDSIPIRVSPEMNNSLLKPFNEDEVNAAVFGMNPTKAPRFDGMPALFFQKY
ncbi:hypothetical protein UlMin_006474 [Ulmus minor]